MPKEASWHNDEILTDLVIEPRERLAGSASLISSRNVQILLLQGVDYCMIVENEGWDQTEVFLRLLLIGGLYTPSSLKDQSGYFQETLRKCGITLYNSEFSVLDSTWMGNSLVTIAKYFLEYGHENNPSGPRTSVEGTVTSQLDEIGNLHIRIFTNSNPLRSSFKAEQFKVSPISS
ncbi:MAG: hypothetical protein WCB46_09655 [Methanoregula sp.]